MMKATEQPIAQFTRQPIAWAWIAAPLLLTLVVHLLVLNRYGIGWDELYLVACADHLDWGYVDHPPLIAGVTFLTRLVLGDALWALRLPCVLAGLTAALITGLTAREFGATRFGQMLAAICVALAPAFLLLRHVLSINSFDLLFWSLAILIVVRIFGRNQPGLWPLFGIVLGLGLLNKYSIGFFCAVLVLGMVLTSARRHVLDRRFWLGAFIATAFFLPHLAWEQRYGWPTLEFMRNAAFSKNLPLSLVDFTKSSVGMMNLFTIPVWLAGLGWLLFHPGGRPYRALGFVLPVLLLVFWANNGKPYYLGAAYLVVFPAGAFVADRLLRARRWAQVALMILVVLPVIVVSPILLPILTQKQLISYARTMGMEFPAEEVGAEATQLPIVFAAMHGYEDVVRAVARAYRALPEADRRVVSIYGQGYGYSAAVDYFGRRYGLPKAIGGHNTYWIWGPGRGTGKVMIIINGETSPLQEIFEKVDLVEVVNSPYAQYRDLNIHVCRGLKEPLVNLWPRVRYYR